MVESSSNQIITPLLAENFERLATEERRIRSANILYINGDPSLKDHMALIHECVNFLIGLAHRDLGTSDNEQVIYGLGIRLCNSTCCSLKLMLEGYYQGATSFLRDLIEIGFLLDYFHYVPSAIPIWKNSTDRKEREQFKPYKIRETLDMRDGFVGKKRGEMYSLLSTYGTHATFEGFQMTIKNGNFILSPFESEKMLKATLEEACKILAYVMVLYYRHWPKSSMREWQLKLSFLESVSVWWSKYMGGDFDMESLEEVRAALKRHQSKLF